MLIALLQTSCGKNHLERMRFGFWCAGFVVVVLAASCGGGGEGPPRIPGGAGTAAVKDGTSPRVGSGGTPSAEHVGGFRAIGGRTLIGPYRLDAGVGGSQVSQSGPTANDAAPSIDSGTEPTEDVRTAIDAAEGGTFAADASGMIDTPNDALTCGSSVCHAGEICCSPSCSLCSPTGAACAHPVCADPNDPTGSITPGTCGAWAAGDSQCPSAGLPHCYVCIMAGPPSGCEIIRIANLVRIFCCP